MIRDDYMTWKNAYSCMEDGIDYVKQIIFHSQIQIISNNSVHFPESFANLVRAWILFYGKKKNSSCLFTAFLA